MNELLLQVKNLSIDFESDSGVVHALKNISFELNKSEIVAVVGESGSGKTITSLSILQLLPSAARIRSGEILFSSGNTSHDLLNASTAALRDMRGNRIAMVFQEPMTSLNPVQTCGKQVAEALKRHKRYSKEVAFKETIELFKKVQLPDPVSVYHRYPHELSGGQKQRVMIAMAVSCKPEILIADEPTTALDVTVQKSIIELLKQLQASMGMSVLYITHDLGLVREIADRVIVMYRGQIIETGTVEKIFGDPKENYTKALLSCHPKPEYKGKPLPMVSDFMKTDDVETIQISTEALQKPPHNNLTDDEFLKVEGLTVKFPVKTNFFGRVIKDFTAVDHVSFSIRKGEMLGLVGESGCGKTTLGRTLLRLIPPSAGSVIINGKNLLRLKADELRHLRKEIQIVFQDPYGSLNPRITIGNAIKEPMMVHHLEKNDRGRKKKAISLLQKVGLTAAQYNRYPHEFSGGQRQRICIARALSLSPGFIVFDESVSALDVSVQAQVLNLLTTLKSEFGFTAIFISHDLSVVHYISDRIMVMQKGGIVESGVADEIFYHPKEAYTKQLIAAIPGRA